jgi:DNA-binding NtrC family response regulator
VQGESGTGKELVASAVHYNSARRARPHIRVSCASLPESLLESELFGYEKGAFTGATDRRIGRFEAASGGTLFLDEIGELPPSFQVKLLRVLQERQIERLGSQRTINVDFRIVSASLRPLEDEIAEGLFREDLFFRINTVAIHLPPLRERREDIPILARSFLEEFTRARQKAVVGFTAEALQAFDAHHWPGNVRELRNVVERAALFCAGSKITIDDLPGNVRTASSAPHRTPAAPQATTLQEAVERAEIEAIKAALETTEGRRSEAAQLLRVSRKTLWEKTKHYGLEPG